MVRLLYYAYVYGSSGGSIMQKCFTITKRISKHGRQAVIVVPKVLEESLKPGTVAEISITVLQEAV